MSLLRHLVLGLVTSSMLVACATDDTTDDLAGTTAADGAEDAKADVSGVYTYFTVERDLRKCAAPMCGGYFVSRVNLGTTRCADGVYRSACYVAQLDLSNLGLADADLAKIDDYAGQGNARVLFKATIGSRTFGATKAGVLQTTEAWMNGTASTPDGVFVKVHDAGIRCIAAPCASLIEKKLNSSRSAMIADVDYAVAGATDRQVETLVEQYFGDGVIVAGDRYTVRENGRTAKGRTATQYWTRMVPAAPAN